MVDEGRSRDELLEENVELRLQVEELKAAETDRKRAEEALRESEKRYRALFDSSLELVYTHDLQGRFLDVNKAALDALGVKRGDVRNTTFADLLDDDEQLARAVEATREIVATGAQQAPTTYRLRTARGDHLWVETVGSLIYQDGKPYAIHGVARDITDRKKADEALRESEAMLQASQSIARIGSFEMDLSTGAVKWSDQLYALFGMKRGAGPLDYEEVLSLIHPDDRERAIQVSSNAARERRAYQLEHRVVHPDGEVLSLLIKGDIVRDEKDEVVKLVGTTQDVTEQRKTEEERKRAEEALRNSERWYRSLIQSTSVAYDVVDLEGNVQYASPSVERMFGWTPEEIKAQSIFALVHPDDVSLAVAEFKELAQHPGTTRTVDIRYRHKDGSWRDIHVSAVNMSADPIVKGIVLTSHDITDRKRAEEALKFGAAILQNVPEAVYLVGLDDGIIKYANPMFERMFGYDPGEIVGKDVAIVNAPTARPPEETKAQIVDTMREAGEWHGEIENIKRDGTRFWCYANVSLFDHPEFGRVTVSVHTDITARKRGEEALRESEVRYRTFVQHFKGIAFRGDLAYSLAFIHGAVEEITGYSEEEFTAGTPRWNEVVHPEDLKAIIEPDHERLLSVANYSTEREYRIICKDGQTRWVHEFVQNVCDDSGRPAFVEGVIHDVTDRKRAKEALRESENRFRTSVETMLDCFGIYSAVRDESGRIVDFRIEYVNEAVCQGNRMTTEEQIGKGLLEILPAHRETGLFDEYCRVVETGEPLVKESLSYEDTYSGQRLARAFDIRATKLGDGFLAVWSDTSARKRAEEALRESEGQLRGLLENAPDTVLTVDREGIITYINRPPAGTTIEGFVGKDSVGTLPPEYRDRYGQAVRRAFETGETQMFEHAYYDATWWTARLVPLKEDDQVAGVMIISTDITDRKRAEEEIRNLARFPSENPSPVLRVSVDGTIIYANGASRPLLDEWKSGEGQPVPEEIGRQVTESHSSGAVREMDVAALERIYSFVIAPVPDADYVNMYGRDVTEHRTLEEHHRHAQKMEAVGLLAGGIAHDFNNLLQGILGYANLLKLRSKERDKTYEAADVIERAGTRAAELTRQLLGFARKGKLRDMPVDVHRTIGETVALLARTIDKRITMVQRLKAEPCMVKGEPGQLQQVVMNLAVNARDAMPEGGELTFETSVVDYTEGCCELPPDATQGKYVLLSMSDTGGGMTPEVRERVFEPFFTTKPQGEGTGMGLAMVYGIVRNHGGSVVVRSDPGKGTTFDIYLPLAGKSARITDTQKLKAMLRGSGRVLVVDDEDTVREILTEMLTSLGYEVRCAPDGREAVEYYREHASEIDLVVLDMTMPGMDGRECFEELKKINPDVKAVVATGHALDGAAQETIDAGALRFIHKPFIMAELADTLAKTLAK